MGAAPAIREGAAVPADAPAGDHDVVRVRTPFKETS
jgi:hypothetical protein